MCNRSEKSFFYDLLVIYWSDIGDLGLVLTGATRATQHKKDRRNRITGSRDNFFRSSDRVESSPDRIAKIPIRSDLSEHYLSVPQYAKNVKKSVARFYLF